MIGRWEMELVQESKQGGNRIVNLIEGQLVC